MFVEESTLAEAIGAPGGFLTTTKIADFTTEFRSGFGAHSDPC